MGLRIALNNNFKRRIAWGEVAVTDRDALLIAMAE
jgi:hypothetical protein